MNSVNFIFTDKKALDDESINILTPKRASKYSAGLDLAAANEAPITLGPLKRMLIPTGVAFEIPTGYEGQIRPRSGLAIKYGISCLNSPGTIDSDYRGEIKVILINHSDKDFVVNRGMRIAQLVIAPVSFFTPVLAPQLNTSDRGNKGFGSSGETSFA